MGAVCGGGGAANHCTLRTKITPVRDVECCSLDEALVLASEIGMKEREERQAPIKAAFAAADDGDGVMTYAEFEQAVMALLPDLKKSQLMRMFRDALRKSLSSNPNALTAEAFANAILREQGFAARQR
jgi:Ca2+-binding EF-hand superfamily protein